MSRIVTGTTEGVAVGVRLVSTIANRHAGPTTLPIGCHVCLGSRTGPLEAYDPQTLRPMPPFIFPGGNRLPEALHYGLRPVSLYLDPVLVLAYLHEIVGSAASQPERGFRPAR